MCVCTCTCISLAGSLPTKNLHCWSFFQALILTWGWGWFIPEFWSWINGTDFTHQLFALKMCRIRWFVLGYILEFVIKVRIDVSSIFVRVWARPHIVSSGQAKVSPRSIYLQYLCSPILYNIFYKFICLCQMHLTDFGYGPVRPCKPEYDSVFLILSLFLISCEFRGRFTHVKPDSWATLGSISRLPWVESRVTMKHEDMASAFFELDQCSTQVNASTQLSSTQCAESQDVA